MTVAGHSAYISASTTTESKTGLVHNYGGKSAHVLATDIVAPDGAPSWVYDRQQLWATVEAFEDVLAAARFKGHADPDKNAKSLQAKEKFLSSCMTGFRSVTALPQEITNAEHLERLALQIVHAVYVKRGLICEYAIHRDKAHNPHLHVLTTTRPLDGETFSRTRFVIGKDKKTGVDELKVIRTEIADCINTFGERYGYNYRVDARSYADQGLHLVPTKHRGWYADKLEAEGKTSRIRLENDEIAQDNLNAIIADPRIIIHAVALKKPVFTRHDIEHELMKRVEGDDRLFVLLKHHIDALPLYDAIGRTANDDVVIEGATYRTTLAQNIASWTDQAVQHDDIHTLGEDARSRALYTTHSYQRFETDLRACIERLTATNTRQPWRWLVNTSRRWTEKKLGFVYAAEQQQALHHLVQGPQLTMLTGRAGTGKSTVLKPLVRAYQLSGYTVMGTAFQGKVVDALSHELGIRAYTLDRFKHGWDDYKKYSRALREDILVGKAYQEAQGQVASAQRFRLTSRHVILVDEANMINATHWQQLLTEVERSGAQVKIIGDNQQIKALQGADVATLIEQHCETLALTTVHRQRVAWMQDASQELNAHRVAEGLQPYLDYGHIQFKGLNPDMALPFIITDHDNANFALMFDYVAAWTKATPAERWHIKALAYTTKEVAVFNAAIREQLKKEDVLGAEYILAGQNYSQGEHIMFTKNDHRGHYVKNLDNSAAKVGVKNGSFGVLERYNEADHTLTVRLKDGRRVGFDVNHYHDFTYGYALTVNKAEGETFSQSFVRFSALMNPNALLIACTRHKDNLQLYCGEEAHNLKEMIHAVGRSDYRAMVYDSVIAGHNDTYFQSAQAYIQAKDEVVRLLEQIQSLEEDDDHNLTPYSAVATLATPDDRSLTLDDLESLALVTGNCIDDQQSPTPHQELWDEVAAQVTLRNTFAAEIMTAWPHHTPFMLQAGIKRTIVEEHAGLRERHLSPAEIHAQETVKAYFNISLQVKTLWQHMAISTANSDESYHEQYTAYHELKTSRDGQAASMAAFPQLYQRFFKLKPLATPDKVTGDDKVTGYVSAWGETYTVRPASYRGMKIQGRHHGELMRLQAFQQHLTTEQASVFQELIIVKQHHAEVSTIYSRLLELQEQPLLVDTTPYWQNRRQEAQARRDYAAYHVIEHAGDHDAWCVRLGIDPLKFLTWASAGEVRLAVQTYEQTPTVAERCQAAQQLTRLLQPALSDKLNTAVYGLFKELGLDHNRLRFEAGVITLHQQNPHQDLAFATLDDLYAAYQSFADYRQQHRDVTEQWQVIRTKLTTEITQLQDTQIHDLQQQGIGDAEMNRDALVATLTAVTPEETIETAVNSNLDYKQNMNSIQAINERLTVSMEALSAEQVAPFKQRQQRLKHLTTHLNKSPWALAQEPLVAAEVQAWQEAWRVKARLAGQVLRQTGNVIQVAFGPMHERMTREDQQIIAPGGNTYIKLMALIDHYRHALTLSEKQAATTQLLHAVRPQPEKFNKNVYHFLNEQNLSYARLQLEHAYYQAVENNIITTPFDINAAYDDLTAYRQLHRESARAWGHIQTTVHAEITAFHDDVRERLSLAALETAQQDVLPEKTKGASQSSMPSNGAKNVLDFKALVSTNNDILQAITALPTQPSRNDEIVTRLSFYGDHLKRQQSGMLDLYLRNHSTSWQTLRAAKLKAAYDLIENYPQLSLCLNQNDTLHTTSEQQRLVKEHHLHNLTVMVEQFMQADITLKPFYASLIQQTLESEQQQNVTPLSSVLQNHNVSQDRIHLMAALKDEVNLNHAYYQVLSYIDKREAFKTLWKTACKDVEQELAVLKFSYNYAKDTLVQEVRALNAAATKHSINRLEQQVIKHNKTKPELTPLLREILASQLILDRELDTDLQTKRCHYLSRHGQQLAPSLQRRCQEYVDQVLAATPALQNDVALWRSQPLPLADQLQLSQHVLDTAPLEHKVSKQLRGFVKRHKDYAVGLDQIFTEAHAQEKGYTTEADKESFNTRIVDLAMRSQALFGKKLELIYKEEVFDTASGTTRTLQSKRGRDLVEAGKARNQAAYSLLSSHKALIERLTHSETLPQHLETQALRHALDTLIIVKENHSLSVTGKPTLQKLFSKASPELQIKILYKIHSQGLDLNDIHLKNPAPDPEQLCNDYSIENTLIKNITSNGIEGVYTRLLDNSSLSLNERIKFRDGDTLWLGPQQQERVCLTTGDWTDGKSSYTIVDRVRVQLTIDHDEAVKWVVEQAQIPLFEGLYRHADSKADDHRAIQPPEPENFFKPSFRDKAEHDDYVTKLNTDRQRAARLWRESVPVAGTLAERYLREHRHIQGEIPETLRFLPHGDGDPGRSKRQPALVAFAHNSKGERRSTQSIYLDPHTANKATHLDVVKKSKGQISGSAVYLQCDSKHRVTFVAEGPETGLSLKESGLQGDILVSLGIGNVHKLIPRHSYIVLCADYDAKNQTTLKNLNHTKAKLIQRGYDVAIVWPETQGPEKVDFNDILKNRGVTAIQDILRTQLGPIAQFNDQPLAQSSTMDQLFSDQAVAYYQNLGANAEQAYWSIREQYVTYAHYLQHNKLVPESTAKAFVERLDEWHQHKVDEHFKMIDPDYYRASRPPEQTIPSLIHQLHTHSQEQQTVVDNAEVDFELLNAERKQHSSNLENTQNYEDRQAYLSLNSYAITNEDIKTYMQRAPNISEIIIGELNDDDIQRLEPFTHLIQIYAHHNPYKDNILYISYLLENDFTRQEIVEDIQQQHILDIKKSILHGLDQGLKPQRIPEFLHRFYIEPTLSQTQGVDAIETADIDQDTLDQNNPTDNKTSTVLEANQYLQPVKRKYGDAVQANYGLTAAEYDHQYQQYKESLNLLSTRDNPQMTPENIQFLMDQGATQEQAIRVIHDMYGGTQTAEIKPLPVSPIPTPNPASTPLASTTQDDMAVIESLIMDLMANHRPFNARKEEVTIAKLEKIVDKLDKATLQRLERNEALMDKINEYAPHVLQRDHEVLTL